MGRKNRFTASRFYLFAVFLATIVCTTVGDCLPREVKDGLLKNFMRNARKAGLPPSSLRCFQQQAQKLAARNISESETSSVCYDHESLKEHMATAMKPCIYDELQLEPLSGLDWSHNLKTSHSAKKSPSDSPRFNSPGSPPHKSKCQGKRTSKAYRNCMKLHDALVVGRRCHCWSGCHFCCINSALGGNDFCFQLYCRATGWCRW